jgi:negative regulator of flagellin synthesis FlgM
MSNNINDLTGGGPTAGSSLPGTRAAPAVAPAAGSAPAEATGSAGDVHITDTASFLASLEPALREAPAVDAARVAAVRTAIDQGHYSVHPQHIATQLLQIEHALGQLHRAAQPEARAADASDSEP